MSQLNKPTIALEVEPAGPIQKLFFKQVITKQALEIGVDVMTHARDLANRELEQLIKQEGMVPVSNVTESLSRVMIDTVNGATWVDGDLMKDSPKAIMLEYVWFVSAQVPARVKPFKDDCRTW